MIKFIKTLFKPKINAAFSYGRFNPCHYGHVNVWKTVHNSSKVWFIGTNPDTHNSDNPLTFDEKNKIALSLYPDIADHFIAEKSILTLASTIYEKLENKNNLTVAYITDDTDWKWSGALLNRYNGVSGTHGYYKFKNIIHVPSPRITSATEMRLAVKQQNPELFYKSCGVSPSFKINNFSYFEIVSLASKNLKSKKI